MELPLGFAGGVILVNALTELVKGYVPEEFNRWIPMGVEVLGFVIGMLLGLGWFQSLFIGLSAMGLYRGAKVAIKGV